MVTNIGAGSRFYVNSFSGNTVALKNMGGDEVKAEKNWWGDPSGPDSGDPNNPIGSGDPIDTTGGPIDVTPWSTARANLSIEPQNQCPTDEDPNDPNSPLYLYFDIMMTDVVGEAVFGGQFYLNYDSTVLTFAEYIGPNVPFIELGRDPVDPADATGAITYGVGEFPPVNGVNGRHADGDTEVRVHRHGVWMPCWKRPSLV